MASSLQDIRLQIVIDVKNQQAIKTLQRSLQTTQTSTNNVSQAFVRQRGVMHPLAEAWRQMTTNLTLTEKAMDAVWRASSHLEEMGRRLLDVSRQIIDLGMGIVDTYADYDYWLRRAAVALNTNVHWQGKLDEAIQDTAVAIGMYSPEEVAEAYNIWGAATGVVVDNQQTLAEVTAAVQHVMIATAGAGGTLETNLKGVSAILGLFNLDASEAAHVTEVLALMTERTQADFGDLISSFTFLGPAADSMRIPFEQVAMMLGIVADNGQRGSRAGRGLSMVIEGLTTPTEEVSAALSEMTLATEGVGKTFEEIVFPDGQFAGMESIIYDLARTMFFATDQERAYFISKGLTNNAIRAFLPLISDTIDMWEADSTAMDRHVTALDKQKYSLENAGAFFEGMTVQMLGSIKAIIGSFKNSFFPILQMVAMKIMELATPILDRLKRAAENVTEFLKDNPGVVDFIVKIGVAIAVVAGLAGSLFALVGTILGLVTAFVMFVSTVLPLVGIFSLLFGIVARFAKAIIDNTAGIRTSFLDLADAVAGLVSKVVGPVEDLRTALEPILTAINEGFNAFIAELAKVIDKVTTAINGLTPEQIENIRTFLKVLGALIGLRVALGLTAGAIGLVTGAIMGLANMIGGTMGIIMTIMRLVGVTRVAGAIRGLILAITGTGGLIAALGVLATNPYVLAIVAIVAAIAAAFAAYETNFAGFRDFVDGIVVWLQTDIFPLVEGFVTNVLAGIGTVVTTLVAWIENDAIPALESFVAWVGVTFGPLVDQIGETIAAILGFFDQLFKGIDADLSGIGLIIGFFLDWFGNYVANTFNTILDTVGGIIENIVRVIEGALQIIEGIFEVFTALLTGDWDLFWTGLWDIVNGIFKIITGFLGIIWSVIVGIFQTALNIVFSIFETIFGLEPGSIMNAIRGFIDNVVKFAGDIMRGIVRGIEGLVNWVIGVISGVVNTIVGLFNIFNRLYTMGQNIVRGIWSGIQSLATWITNSIMGFVKAILPDVIEDMLGIRSPSTVMAAYGKNIVEGLARGITQTNDAYKAMEVTTSRLASLAESGTAGIGFEGNFTGGLLSSTNERVVRLEVEVTSPDGSIDSIDMSKLADLITGSSMVRAIEHVSATE